MTRGQAFDFVRDAGDRSGGGTAFAAEAPIELPRRRIPVSNVALPPASATVSPKPRMLGVAFVCIAAAATVASLGTVMHSPWPRDTTNIESDKPFSLTGAWRDMTRAIEVRNGWQSETPPPQRSLEDVMPAAPVAEPTASVATPSPRDEAMEVATRHALAATTEEPRIAVVAPVIEPPIEPSAKQDAETRSPQPLVQETQPERVTSSAPLAMPEVVPEPMIEQVKSNLPLASVAEFLIALPQIEQPSAAEDWLILPAFPLHPVVAVEDEPAEPAATKPNVKSIATAVSDQSKTRPRPKPKSVSPTSSGASVSNTNAVDTQVQDKP